MRQWREVFEIETTGKGLYEITDRLRAMVDKAGAGTGLLTVFIHHTSASLVIQENADPTVREDLLAFFARVVPEDSRLYRHDSEGPDDMPAHIKAALTAVQLSIPLDQRRLDLGTWQGVYVFEHRTRPHRRKISLLLQGE